MVVYRIGKTKFSNDLSGEGARLHGGRWNHILTPCVYTSGSRSLALLEFSVNINIDDIPKTLSITTIEIAEKAVLKMSIDQLPSNWTAYPAPATTKDFGTRLLAAKEYAVIQLPSTIIQQEFNYLLNPMHPNVHMFKIVDVEDFVYGVRIKTSVRY
jgi:RES domain-containing protein